MATGIAPSLLLALHHLMLRRARASLQTGIHALAQSLARALNPVLVPDLPPKISVKCSLIFVFVPPPPPHLLKRLVGKDNFLIVMIGSRSKVFHFFYFTYLL